LSESLAAHAMGRKASSTMTTRKRHTPEQVTLIGVSLSPGAGVRAWRRDRCHGNWAGYVEAGRQGGVVSRRLGGDELPDWPSSCVTSFVIPWMLFRFRLVPRVISVVGLIGYALVFLSGMGNWFGVIDPSVGGNGAFLAIPVAVFEIILLPFWLFFKGFKTPEAAERIPAAVAMPGAEA